MASGSRQAGRQAIKQAGSTAGRQADRPAHQSADPMITNPPSNATLTIHQPSLHRGGHEGEVRPHKVIVLNVLNARAKAPAITTAQRTAAIIKYHATNNSMLPNMFQVKVMSQSNIFRTCLMHFCRTQRRSWSTQVQQKFNFSSTTSSTTT